MKPAWPQYTCTLTFIYKILKQYNVDIDLNYLSKYLNIIVPDDVENPFGYPIGNAKGEFGITLPDVARGYTEVLDKYLPGFIYKHVPLDIIPYNMYEELIISVLQNHINLGVGYDYSYLYNDPGISKHVSFIESLSHNEIVIMDYYLQTEGVTFKVQYEQIIPAMSVIAGGFWIIGERSKVHKVLDENGI